MPTAGHPPHTAPIEASPVKHARRIFPNASLALGFATLATSLPGPAGSAEIPPGMVGGPEIPVMAKSAGTTARTLPFQLYRLGGHLTVERAESEIPGFTAAPQGPAGEVARYDAIVRAALAPSLDRERVQGLNMSLFPMSTAVADVQSPKPGSVDILLDLPTGFLASKAFDLRFAKEAQETLVTPLTAAGAREIRTLVKDPATGLYKGMLEFLQPAPVPAREGPYNPGAEADVPLPNHGVAPAAAAGPRAPGVPPFASGQVAGALTGRTVVFNQAHGWLDDTSRWRVQRSKLFDTLEDFSCAELLNLYVLPAMLNAGAKVHTVREPDLNTNMVIVDNADPAPAYVETGAGWGSSGATRGFSRANFPIASISVDPWAAASGVTRFNSITGGAATAAASFTPNIPVAGFYNVYASWAASTNRTTSAHFQVRHSGGVSDFRLNQRKDGEMWLLLGNFHFEVGTGGGLTVLNDGADTGGIVSVDAVRFGGGMGDTVRRTHGVSGKPRWQEEAMNYLQYNGYFGHSNVFNSSASSDESLGWTNRPRFAEWIRAHNSETGNIVSIGWHTNAISNQACVNNVDVQTATARGTNAFRDVDADCIPGTITFTAAVHTAVMDSIKKLYISGANSWTDRGIVGSNSYGESNQTNFGNVPGFFFEGLFGDNIPDTNLYKDPKFRVAVARGMQQGVITYFGGTVYPPEPPVSPRVRNLGGGQVRLDWAAGPVRATNLPYGSAATSYRVHRSGNGFGFDNGTDTAGLTNLTVTLQPGETVYFRVSATNAAGVSFPTEVIGTRATGLGAVPVLIVNGNDRADQSMASRYSNPNVGGCSGSNPNTVANQDPRVFARGNYIVRHAQALAAAGYCFDSCANECVEAGQVALNPYRAIDWIGSQEADLDTADAVNTPAFLPATRTLLDNYMKAGGRLLVSGSELAWDFGRAAATQDKKDFLANTLKATYGADGSAVYQAQGATGSIFQGIATFNYDDGNGGTYNVRFPDVLTPAGGAVAAMGYVGSAEVGSAAIQHEGLWTGGTAPGKLVFMAFGFETINDTGVRDQVMRRTMDWFAQVPSQRIDSYTTGTVGWGPFAPDAPGFTEVGYGSGALLARLYPTSPGVSRVAGWLASTATSMPYATVGAGRHARAKFWVYSGGQTDPADRAQVPNMRLRVSNRFAVTSILDVLHHNSVDPQGDALASDFRPSSDPAKPSVYRVDLDPIDVPFLVANGATEIVNRGFEAYGTEPQENGYVALAESTLGSYPALGEATTPDTLIKVYDPAANDLSNFAVTARRLAPIGNTFVEEAGTLPTVTGGPGMGVTLDTTAIPADRIGVAAADFTGGAAADTDRTLRARIEPNRLYKIRFHATSVQACSLQSMVRFRARTAKFQWTQRTEVGGAWAIGVDPATGNAAIAIQAAPGTGCLNPDQRTPGEAGGWYNVLMHSPMNADIRPEFDTAVDLAARMPNLTAQDPPGVNTGGLATSRRDILMGVDLVDSISVGPNAGLEQGNVTVDRIEVRRYTPLPD